MNPKLWQVAAIISLCVAAALLVMSGNSILPRAIAMLFVFLSLWLTKQRRVAEKLKQSEALRSAIVEKS